MEFWWIVVIILLFLAVKIKRKGVAAITKPIYNRIPIFRYCFERQRDARLALWIHAVGHNKPLLIASLQHLDAHTIVTAMQGGQSFIEALSSIPTLSPSLRYAVRSDKSAENNCETMNLCQELTKIQAEKAGERLGRWKFFASYIGIGILVAFMLVAIYMPIFTLGAVI